MKRTAKYFYPLLLLALLGILSLASPALASVNISTTIDRTHLTLEDALTLSVKVNGVRESAEPTLPPLPDFKIEFQGSSSSVQIINGVMNSSVTFRYLLFPNNEGTFVIGGVRLIREGKSYVSPSLTVEVNPPSSTLPDGEKDIFAEVIVSKTTAYLQEQITLTYRFYRKVQVRNLSLDAPLEHFRRVPLGQPTETGKIINGARYYVSEIYYALFPLQAGVLKIPGANFQMDVLKRGHESRRSFGSGHLPNGMFDNPFFSDGANFERKIIRTRPIEITVLPFPEENQPTGFNNLVGPVSIHSELKQNILTTGDTATWILTLKGHADMTEATVDMQEMPGQFKIYKDQPVLEEKTVNGLLEGTKAFVFALIPTSAGNLTLPSVTINFWDTEKMAYSSASTESSSLTVKPGTHQPSANSLTKSTPRPLSQNLNGPELLPIHTRQDLFDRAGSLFLSPGFWVGILFIPMFCYMFFKSFYGNRIKMKQDKVFARKQKAYSKASKRLKDLEQHQETGSSNAREVSLIFREYLGDRFEFQGTALTPEEVDNRLRGVTLAEEHIATVLDLLSKCQTVEFAPSDLLHEDNLVVESLSLLSKLENAKE